MIRYTNIKCPYHYKEELVNWAIRVFNNPPTKGERLKKFKKYPIKQLYAIWYKTHGGMG
jgi:hypothetical protein